MGTTTTDVKLAAWRSLITTHVALANALGEHLEAATGLKPEWYEVLLHLYESDGGRLRMHELAERRLLSRSSATRLIDRMSAAGLVERGVCEDDRRGTWVALTDVGVAEFKVAGRIHLQDIERHFSRHISYDEARELVELMERLRSANEPRS